MNLSKPLPPMEAGDTLETQATMADSQVSSDFMVWIFYVLTRVSD